MKHAFPYSQNNFFVIKMNSDLQPGIQFLRFKLWIMYFCRCFISWVLFIYSSDRAFILSLLFKIFQVVTNFILSGNLDLLEGWTVFTSVLTRKMEFKSKHKTRVNCHVRSFAVGFWTTQIAVTFAGVLRTAGSNSSCCTRIHRTHIYGNGYLRLYSNSHKVTTWNTSYSGLPGDLENLENLEKPGKRQK